MENEALLIMDVQKSIVGRFQDRLGNLCENLKLVTDAARQKGVIPIYIRVAFRGDGSDVNKDNKVFANLASDFSMGAEGIEIEPSCGYNATDIVVNKKRVSAFAGSDLELVLRSLHIKTLVLSGIATSGVVLSTVRQAADLDFGLIVLSNCCADMDDEVHSVLINKVFPRQCEVMTAKEYCSRLTGK
jgi:nicotinamidase-related amidase